MFKIVTELILFILTFVTLLKSFVAGRAIMVEPPHRSSLWRFNYNTTVNLRDDSINCGGYDWQWGVHGGRCGVCGDMWNGSQDNDDNGKFATGIIVRSYTDGHYINVTFEVSSNYLGYVEFRLCPRNVTGTPLEQSCFDRYPLWIDESHGTRYHIGSRGGIYDIHIRLPVGLVCKKCVLQWKYKTGYRYNGENQCKCLGCGNQEQYVNCADIEIQPNGGWNNNGVTSHSHDLTSHGSNMTSGTIDFASHHHDRLASFNQRLANAGSFINGPNGFNTTSFQPPSQVPHVHGHHGQVSLTAFGPTVDVSSLLRPLPPDAFLPPSRSPTTGSRSASLPPLFSPSATLSPMETQITSTAKPVIDLNTLPSYASPSSSLSSSPVTSSVTSYLHNTTSVLNITQPSRSTIKLDNIRKEIVNHLGSEVTGEIKVFSNSNNAGKSKPATSTHSGRFGDRSRLRTSSNVMTSQHGFRTFTERPVRTDVPNTQFVSVSNILDRFYPNYVSPLLYSLTRPRTSGMNIGAGCDVNSDEFRCKARGIYNNSPGISKWCEVNCRASNCVNFMCECGCEDTSKRKPKNSSCHAIADFHGVEGMDEWCVANCKVGYCPANTCSIEDCLQSQTLTR